MTWTTARRSLRRLSSAAARFQTATGEPRCSRVSPPLYSSLVYSLQKCETYADMKKELDAEIIFLKDFGLDAGKLSHAHLADEQGA